MATIQIKISIKFFSNKIMLELFSLINPLKLRRRVKRIYLSQEGYLTQSNFLVSTYFIYVNIVATKKIHVMNQSNQL